MLHQCLVHDSLRLNKSNDLSHIIWVILTELNSGFVIHKNYYDE